MATKKGSNETIRTTDSMNRKANLCARFVISILKVFRMCKPKKRKNNKLPNTI